MQLNVKDLPLFKSIPSEDDPFMKYKNVAYGNL